MEPAHAGILGFLAHADNMGAGFLVPRWVWLLLVADWAFGRFAKVHPNSSVAAAFYAAHKLLGHIPAVGPVLAWIAEPARSEAPAPSVPTLVASPPPPPAP